MKKYSFRQKFSYWFDNRMSRGSASMIKILGILTLAVVLLVAGAVTVFCVEEDIDFGSALWDSFATTVNAWVTYSGDGSPLYVVLMSLAAVAGLFIASVLIGIVGSAIEEKLSELKRGTSLVLERGHTVVIGFNEQTYEIINQLSLASGGAGCCIVVAGDTEKEEMEQLIRDRLELAKNVRIICRRCNPFEPSSLQCCSVAESASVIVNLSDSVQTVKCILALGCLLEGTEEAPRITCAITQQRAVVPAALAGAGRADVLDVGEIVARLIAHTCLQAGISDVFTEILSFQGDEFYFKDCPELQGSSFSEISRCFSQCVVLGIATDNGVVLVPDSNRTLLRGERILLMAPNAKAAVPDTAAADFDTKVFAQDQKHKAAHKDNILLIGANELAPTVVSQLDRVVDKGSIITVAGSRGTAFEALLSNLELTLSDANPTDPAELEALVLSGVQHIIMLSDSEKPDSEADDDTLMILLHLREIKQRHSLSINITTQMRSAETARLARCDDVADFIVGADIATLMVVQTANERELLPVFSELLSNFGSEFYLMPAENFVKTGTELSVATLIEAALRRNSVFVGYKRASNAAVLNPSVHERITLETGDSLVLLSRDD